MAEASGAWYHWSSSASSKNCLVQAVQFKICLTSLLEPVQVSACPPYCFMSLIRSIGGLIILSLFQNRWPVDQCAHIFDHLTKRFFGDAQRKNRTIVSRMRHAFRCWLSDSCYEANILENALQEVFGEHRRMFDPNPVKSSTRIAVTATAVTDAHPVIFSNYNGVGGADKDCGSLFISSEQCDSSTNQTV